MTSAAVPGGAPPPQRPRPSLPPLADGGARRLVRLDVRRHDDGRLTVDGAATDEVGSARRVVAAASVRVEVRDGRVRSLDTTPSAPTTSLVGLGVVGGFRAAARAALPDPGEGSPSLVAALLEDLPVATLVSGYLEVRAARVGAGAEDHLAGVCSGWREDGAPLAQARLLGVPPISDLTPVRDARLGEPFPPLGPGALRRVRWIDVAPDADGARVQAGFRDTCRDDTGPEGVLHEYALTARSSPDGAVTDVRPEPRVLPFSECLLAVGPARQVTGMAHELPRTVPRLLAGTLGCTHLTDLVRSLGCLPALLRTAAGPAQD